jgi:hypothetical protein
MGWLYIVIFCLSSIWFFNMFIKIIEKLLNREDVSQEKVIASVAILIMIATGIIIIS